MPMVSPDRAGLGWFAAGASVSLRQVNPTVMPPILAHGTSQPYRSARERIVGHGAGSPHSRQKLASP